MHWHLQMTAAYGKQHICLYFCIHFWGLIQCQGEPLSIAVVFTEISEISTILFSSLLFDTAINTHQRSWRSWRMKTYLDHVWNIFNKSFKVKKLVPIKKIIWKLSETVLDPTELHCTNTIVIFCVDYPFNIIFWV